MVDATTHLAEKPRWLTPVLFSTTIFLSASLLFFVQPLFTKIVLPHVGGAPAVWTTAMLFFQGSIRISYAHWPLGRSPTAAARTARGVGRLGKTAR